MIPGIYAMELHFFTGFHWFVILFSSASWVNRQTINSLTPGRCSNIKSVIWECSVQIMFMNTSCEIALRRVPKQYNDIIMGAIASQITSLTIANSTVYSEADQIKYHSSASLAFVQGIPQEPVNYLHKWPVMQKMFLFDDVIMKYLIIGQRLSR